MAALEGGLTFQKGLGAVHALSHPLGGLKRVSLHHGTLNAVLLPYVLEFNQEHSGVKYDALRQRVRNWARGRPRRLLPQPQFAARDAIDPC